MVRRRLCCKCGPIKELSPRAHTAAPDRDPVGDGFKTFNSVVPPVTVQKNDIDLGLPINLQLTYAVRFRYGAFVAGSETGSRKDASSDP